MFKLPFSDIKIPKKHIIIAVLLVAALIFALHQRQKIIVEKALSYAENLSQYEERFSYYYYENHESTYTTLIGNYKAGLDSKNLSVLEDCCLQLDTLEHTVIMENTVLFENEIEKLENANLMNAYDEELEKIAQIQADAQAKLEQHLFTEITPLLKEWTAILSNMTVIADNLSIYVNQIDVSQYPQINLYLDIHNIENDKTPKGLKKEYLYLTEMVSSNVNNYSSSDTANAAASLEYTALSMEQLGNTLPLSIHIVADMDSAKTEEEAMVITNTITSFSDKALFKASSLIETDASHFYDSLMEAITVSASGEGAKCVIAFTAGEDTNSIHSWEDVVARSKECGVPVFMIGIGKDVSPYVLERIGTQTNGFYRNINDVSSLGKIFEKAYTYMTKLYRVTFVSEADITFNGNRFLHIAYQHRDFGGACDYNYTVKHLKKAGN